MPALVSPLIRELRALGITLLLEQDPQPPARTGVTTVVRKTICSLRVYQFPALLELDTDIEDVLNPAPNGSHVLLATSNPSLDLGLLRRIKLRPCRRRRCRGAYARSLRFWPGAEPDEASYCRSTALQRQNQRRQQLATGASTPA